MSGGWHRVSGGVRPAREGGVPRRLWAARRSLSRGKGGEWRPVAAGEPVPALPGTAARRSGRDTPGAGERAGREPQGSCWTLSPSLFCPRSRTQVASNKVSAQVSTGGLCRPSRLAHPGCAASRCPAPEISGIGSGGSWPRPTWSLPCVSQASSFSERTETLVSAKIMGLTDVLQC